ncbi:NB-ARC domain-containing protein [Kitasatospora sp. NPDC058184]|uniref:NB-ARC domain-containing protein n=1 Tax=Kitasatospora sp. NPDC058184 TaxID=3346370 RepID=UPI0036D8ACDC
MHNSIRGGTFHAPVVQADTAHVTVTARPPTIAGLPPVTSAFTGRDQDLAELRALLAPDGPSTVTVTGLGGIGKTTLALAAGHALLGEGHYSAALFVDLRGYDETPVEAGQALDTLLRALGVPAEHIPPEQESRATLYRARLEQHGGGVLVIADNASAADQVRPLQPPPATRHRLLVTSRETLPGLGARLHRLGVLDAEAAVALLDTAVRAARPADGRVAIDAEGGRRTARLCGHLPLALRLAAAQLILDQHLGAAELADDLAGGTGRLDLLHDGETGIRLTLDRSYRRLTPAQAELFRFLPVCVGSDVSTEAGAALIGRTVRETRPLFAQLVGAALIEQSPSKGRWYLHDLVRLYALEQLGKDPELGARGLSRLTEYYVTTAHAANRRAASSPGRSDAGPFPERAAALAWLDRERANMVAMILGLAEVGIHRGVARLSPVVVPGLIHGGRADLAIAVTEAALRAADSMGTSDVEAEVWNNHGISLGLASRCEEAVEAHRRALAVARSRRDREGETIALLNLGERLRVMGRLDEALEFLERACVLCEECDDRFCQAMAWESTGSALRALDRNDEAARAQGQARGIFRALGVERADARWLRAPDTTRAAAVWIHA